MHTIQDTITIQRSANECFNLFTQYERLPRYMGDVMTISRTDRPDILHWTVKGPMEIPVSWDAIITLQDQSHQINWHTTDNAQVPNSGEVRFEEINPNETRMSALVHYEPPLGELGQKVAEMIKNPQDMLSHGLQEFKRAAESQTRVTAAAQ